MSKKRLYRWMIYVCLWLGFVAVVYCLVAYFDSSLGKHKLTKVIKDILPLALAVPTALIAYAFSRRNSYLVALREFWQQLVPTIHSAVQYTHLPNPSQTDYRSIMVKLSSAIDLMRGVFSNISAKDGNIGLFPHENLKDIHSIISWLGFEKDFRKDDAGNARRCIIALWQEMFHAMLNEFDRDVPVTPISKYLHKEKKSVADFLLNDDLKNEDLERIKPASHPRG